MPSLLKILPSTTRAEPYRPCTPEQQKLAADNIGLVGGHLHRCRRFPWVRHFGLDWDSAIAAGSLGLTRAASRFKPEKGFAFSTYADPYIRQALQEEADMRKTAKLKMLTLNARRPEDEFTGNSVADIEAPDHRPDTRRAVDAIDEIDVRMRPLKRRERVVLFLRGRGLTLRQVGNRFGVSKERIRQIEATARRKFCREVG